MKMKTVETGLVRVLLVDEREAAMRVFVRRCDCGRRALSPATGGRSKMRAGWIYREGHDLCQKCWRGVYESFRVRQVLGEAQAA